MTVKLSSLRVVSDFDASGYQRGMAAKVAADQSGIASSEKVGAALARQDAAAGSTTAAVERMSRQWITGYGHSAKFEAGLKSINAALERGLAPQRAAMLVEGLSRQFGRTAEASHVAARGFVQLAPIVAAVNAKFADQPALLERAAAANDNAARRMSQMAAAGQAAVVGLSPLTGVVGSIASALGPVGIAMGVVALAANSIAASGDVWTRYGNQLQAAGVSSATLATTQRELADLAIGTRSSLEATVSLYARMTRASSELGVSQQDVRRATEILGKEMANAGLSTAEAAGGLLQFSQGLQAGRFQGDELRSVLESLPGVARAIAKEFGTTTAGLKEMGSAGELSSARVFQAVLKAGKGIDEAFGKTLPTAAQAMENLGTASTRLFAEIDRRLGISQNRAQAIVELGQAMTWMAEKLENAGKASSAGNVAMINQAIALAKQDIKFFDSRGMTTDAEEARRRLADLEQQLRLVEGAGAAAAVGARQAADGFGDVARLATTAANAVAGFNQALRSINMGIPDVAKVLTAQKEMAELRTLNAQAADKSHQTMVAESLDARDAAAAQGRHAERMQVLTKATEERTRVITGATALEKEFGKTLQTTTIAGLEGVAKGNAQARASYEERNRQIDESIKLGMSESEATGLRAKNEAILAKELKNVAAAEKAKGGSASSGSGSDAYDNALQRARDQIEELKLQQEAASKATAEVYRLTEAHRLRRAAMQAGRADEAGVKEEIDRVASALAKQRVATEQAIEANRRLKESFDFIGDSFKSFAEDILTGTDGINGALKNLGKGFLSASLDALISGKGPLAGLTGMAPADKNSQGGLMGWLQGLPKAVQTGSEKGSRAGSIDGTVIGMGTFVSSEGSSWLGGISGKELAGGLTAVASLAGAYGSGMAASSYGQAVGGGALSGAMGGAALASSLGLSGAMSMALPGIGLVIGAGLAPYGGKQITRKEKARVRAQRLGF